MKKYLFLVIAMGCFLGTASAQEYQLVWSDEFNTDGRLDSTVWNYENGFTRNEELQWYQADNAWCKDGKLIIEARMEKRKNPLYQPGSNQWRTSREYITCTSSSVTTAGKKEFRYGRFEIRAKIPTASGAWPAIWTLGRDMEWPSNGEIDIMEYYRINDVPHILANVAWGTERRYNARWASKAIPFTHFTGKDADWSSKFHVWRMDWDETAIKLYLDDELLNEVALSQTVNGSLGGFKNPFMQPHYVLLNLAIGGQHGGNPEVAAFPLRYEIDYVRVYQKKVKPIRSGETWPDTDGVHINAHGGGILQHEGKYYWYGEHRGAPGADARLGVTCYSSTDLVSWKNEGIVMPVSDDPKSDITKGCTIERPKVIYNAKTGKFVLWFHLELKGKGYEAARAGIAVSDSPVGPFRFLRSGRVNPGVYPQNMTKAEQAIKWNMNKYKWWTPSWRQAVEQGMFVKRDLNGGQMSRDMTLYVDDDGRAYHIYSSEENLTLHIAELSDDYLTHSGRFIRIFPGGHNEAPAIFKKDGVYWMITSGCTGWAPNEARMMSATSIWGPWTQHPNPCVGENAHLTFGSQSTYILPRSTEAGTEYLFMADIWRPNNLNDSRYLWLPVGFGTDAKPYLKWQAEWLPAMD